MGRLPLCILGLLLSFIPLSQAQVSGVLREVWTNVDGNSIAELTGSPNYPDSPVLRTVEADFRTPTDWSERYGTRMRAYLTPTDAGDYTFWISGDDNCELWLSSTDDPANKVRIARVPNYTNVRTWTTYAEQRSAPITLAAGQRYYIEALQKEGGGGDHLAVAWALSPSTTPVIIPGSVLTPYEIPATVPSGMVVEAGRNGTQYSPNLSVIATGQAIDLTSANRTPTYAWTKVSGPTATILTPTALNTQINFTAAGTYVFRLTATTPAGVTPVLSGSDTVTYVIQPKLAPDAGSALTEFWFNVTGKTVANLLTSVDYPQFPHAHRVVTELTAPVNQADLFGSRTRGFILVPTSGDYRFYIAADESAEFLLSSDDSTANLLTRATVATAVGVNGHYTTPGQDSGPITLVAGRRYAFEIRSKEEYGTDHCSVLWQRAGTDYVTDITAEYLAPPADAATIIASTQDFDMVSDYVLNAGRDQCIYLPQNVVNLSAYESRRFYVNDTVTRQWSKQSGPGTVTFSAPTALTTTATFSAAGTYILKYAVTTSRNVSVDTVKVEVKPAISANTGFLTRQVWWNKNYTTLDQFRADPAFPNFPDIVDNLPELRQAADWSSLYGTRVTGLLRIPANGTNTTPVNYTFYVSWDDLAEFSISTDATPANLQKVCYTTKPSGREVYTTEASQTSAPIALRPGGTYFVELLHKETYSSDYFAVAWAKEGDRRPQLISGAYFEPTTRGAPTFSQSVKVYAAAGRDRTYWWPHDRIKLAGSVIRAMTTTNTLVTTWRKVSGPAATIVTPAALDSEVALTGPGAYVFELAVADGDIVHKDTVLITVNAAQRGVTGYLTRSVWFDVDGNTVASLKTADPTLAYPHMQDLLPGVEAVENWADYIGTRLKGTLTVPVSGIYYLYVTSNEAADLNFDIKDGNGLQRLAYNDHSESVRAFDAHTYQKTPPLNLIAGVAYPIELLHKELTGSDHYSIAFEGPATNGREILSRGFITPENSAPIYNPEITVALGADRTLLWPTNEIRLAAIVYDLKQGPQPLTYKWSSTSKGVTFDDTSGPVSTLKFGAPGVYEVKMTVSDGQNTGSDTVLVTVNNPLAAGSGGILREAWTNVSGYTLNDLKNSAAYQKAPTFSDILTKFEAPTNWADFYGQRLTGTVQVPAEADYFFYIASDDESELWMNTTGETATGATKIAFTTSGTGQYNWTNRASQKSAAIHLMPGKKYYIQALHKEGNSSDYIAVAYKRTDVTTEPVVIPGVMLSPPAGTKATSFDGQMAVEAGEDQTGVWPKARYSVKGVAVDYIPGPQALVYRWSVAAAPAGQATKVIFDAPTALTSGVQFPAAGAYKLQLTATDGLVSRSDTLSITIGAQLAVGTGTILAERFNGITGSWVTDLTKNAKYPNSPDTRVQLTKAEIPSNTGDNYGMLIRGYLYAPVSGIYRLNLASDEWSEVYLSTDRTPENKALACFVPAATDYYEWRKYPDYQLSRPISLVAKVPYYIEIRFKESGSRDHLALAWLRPGTTAFEVIDGAYLSPFKLADAAAPTIVLTGGSDVTIGVGSTYVDPGYTATDAVDGNINGRVTVEGSVDVNTPGTYILRYVVTDAAGNQSVIAVRRVTVAVAANEQPVYPPESGGVYSTAAWPRTAPTDRDAARFLKQATFGPNDASVARVKAVGYDAWINEQIALPPTLHLPQMDLISQYKGAREQLRTLAATSQTMSIMPGTMMPLPSASLATSDRLYTWWTTATLAPDQLRQRVAFALSEVLVVSDQGPALQNYPRGMANYYDILVKRAFGNYRDILEEVTLNPIMGMWLTMLRSQKTQPDENYAREIMQLFSIGLEHLNKDGTFKRDGSGNAIPTYTQNEINELARAFTGWTFSGSTSFDYVYPVDDINPMMSFEAKHDRGQKVILGGATIPAGQTAPQDVKRAVDIIFNHPNLGPFIARRLIQRLVTSNPSRAYLYRVSLKFDNNGSGVRGDLAAVVKAILMDPEARIGTGSNAPYKLSEPITRLTRVLRAFPKPPSDASPALGRQLLSNTIAPFVQSPLQATTVFNYFHPDYQPPGPLQDAGLYAPEFETNTELSVVDTANYFFDGVRSGFPSDANPKVAIDLTPLTALFSTPDALVNKLETLLLARPMSADLRASLLAVHTAYAATPSEAIQNMLGLLCASPEFTVDR